VRVICIPDVVDPDRPADGDRAAEVARGAAGADHRDRMRIRHAIVVSRQRPSRRCADAERREVVAGDERDAHALAGCGCIRRGADIVAIEHGNAGDAREGVAGGVQQRVHEGGRQRRVARHQSIGRRHGQLTQQHRVHRREDRRAPADPDREREDDADGERPAAQRQANAVSDVLDQALDPGCKPGHVSSFTVALPKSSAAPVLRSPRHRR
jgi:hypothetical protein